MGRRRNHDRRDLPPNLYVRNDGYYSYRDPRNGKEYGLGRDRRLAVSESIQVNIELLADAGRISLSARISQVDSVTFHSWLERYEKIIAARGLKQKILIDYASKLRSIKERVQDIPIAEITTRQITMILNDYANEGKPGELSGLDFSGEPPGFHELRSLSARLYGKQAGDSFAQHLLGYKSGIMTAKYRDDRGREWNRIEVG